MLLRVYTPSVLCIIPVIQLNRNMFKVRQMPGLMRP
jgi:hypothetical protein